MTIRNRITLCSLALLGACASMSEEACKQAAQSGWEPIGSRDGRQGEFPEPRLAAHREACQKAGVTPDPVGYMAGWRRGILGYCTVQNGYSVGLSGASLHDELCEGVGDGALLVSANYRLGRQVYELKEAIRQREREINDLEKKLNDKTLSPESTREIRSRIRRHSDELSSTRSMLFDAQSRPMITR